MSKSKILLNSIKYGIGAGVVLGAMGALTSTIIYYSSSKLFLDITTALYLNSLSAGLSILLFTAIFAAIGVFAGIVRGIIIESLRPASNVADALSALERAGILTQENQRLVEAHHNPFLLGLALDNLKLAGILNQEHFNLVAAHQNPISLASALSTLQGAGILTPENQRIVAAHDHINNLVSAFSCLQIAGILTPGNLDALLAPNHASLLTQDARVLIWHRIPADLLTQANFQNLLTAAEVPNPIQALQMALNQIIDIPAQAGAEAAFNPGQSTHTASVHRSVSKSARALWSDYNLKLNLDKTIINIKAYVNGLDDSPKNQAAKRCIERITAPNYAFVDRDSGVSTQQLLALAWLALHDEQKREGLLQDAKSLFVEGLYEIQRGYNLSKEGIDDEALNDRTICPAGTFNKIVEKLVGIHPNIEVQFITYEGALQKILKLAPQHALDYLQKLDERDKAQASQLIKKLLEDGNLESIWGHIKDRVQADIWGEFAEAYSGNQEHPQFQALIAYGGQIGIPDEDALKQILTPSQAAHSMFAAAADVEQKEDLNPSVKNSYSRQVST